MTQREQLIKQLRHALHEATNPRQDVIEFELGNTDFCFEDVDDTPALEFDDE